MGKFHDDLLNNKLYHPTQKKFNLPWWEEVFTTYKENDTDDVRLYEAAKWVFKTVDFIRHNISDIDFSSLRKKDLVESYFGSVNRDVNLLLEMQEQIEIKDEVFFEEVMHPGF